MFWPVAVIILFLAWITLEWYQLRYFFEEQYLVTGFFAEGMRCKKMSLLKQLPDTTITWSDMDSASLIEGFDSSRWWHRNIKQRFGVGISIRLVVHTKTQGAFVFHLQPEATMSALAPLHKKMSAFDKNSELLSEMEKHHIPVKKTESSLIEAMTDKNKDWYRKT